MSGMNDEPDSPGSSSDSRTPGEKLAAASSAMRLDWASMGSSAHEPRLIDKRGNATQSQLLSSFVLKQLAGTLPMRFAYSDWSLLYSTSVHGISLNTFYANTAGCGCCILAIKDREGNLFGGFCSE